MIPSMLRLPPLLSLPRFSKKLMVCVFLAMPGALIAEEATSVSQYGITWTFDRPYTVGKFVTGDYWVIGPVTVVSVSPAAGPAPASEPVTNAKGRYGAAGLKDDKRMRNGSQIVQGPEQNAGKHSTGFDHQGYDSRSINYAPTLSVSFPCKLGVNQSLTSSISSENYDKDGKLLTPIVLGVFSSGPYGVYTNPLALETAAILTCLDKAPPKDSFRPPYAGSAKPIYEAKDIHWELLPKLKPVPSTPDWQKMERVFQRPWLDHINNWGIQFTLPGQNQPGYGREFCWMTSTAALMLLLDVPQEKKQQLMYEYLQLGIDLSGIAKSGRHWFPDGGHWQGRKWPILFASIMLNKPEIRDFPHVNPKISVYGGIYVDDSGGVPPPTTLFQEDIDTYYGKGAYGQTALWQIGSHTGPKPPYLEKKIEEYDQGNNFCDQYLMNNAGSWIGNALAARYMKALAIWNHDAFFDFEDYWMSKNNAIYKPVKWSPKGCTRSTNLFFEEMWDAYRAGAPVQPGGKDNLKWVWDEDKVNKGAYGHFVQNPPIPATPK